MLSYRNSLYLTFLDICRAHLLISQFTEKSYGTEVSPTEAYILTELKSDPGLNISSLARILNLDKSSISRAVSRLQREKFLAKESGYLLLKKAQDFLQLQDRFNQSQLKKLAANLTAPELKNLANLFWKFVEGGPASDNPKIRLLMAIRKVTRLWQVTGPSIFGSGFNALDWLVLSEIKYNKANLTQLSLKLGILLNTMSQKLKSYSQKKLLEMSEDSGDQRAKIISLSRKGLAALLAIEEAGQGSCNDGFKQFTIEEIELFIELFWKYTFSSAPYRSCRYTDKVQLMRTEDPLELQQMRWQLIRKLATYDSSEYLLTEHFFSSKNHNFTFIKDGIVIGGLEAVREGETVFKIVNMLLPDTRRVPEKFIAEILSKLMAEKIQVKFCQDFR